MYSFADKFYVKIDEESDPFLRQTQIGEELGLMKWCNFFDRFDLNDYRLANEKIELQRPIQGLAIINDRHRDLASNLHTTLGQLSNQAGFVNRLEQSRAKLAMNFEGRINDLTAHVFQTSRPLIPPNILDGQASTSQKYY